MLCVSRILGNESEKNNKYKQNRELIK